MKYLLAVVIISFLGCSTVKNNSFPRIVSNGCGTFAIQIRQNIDNKDTVYSYLGVKQNTIVNHCGVIWGGLLISGTGYSCSEDTISVRYIINAHHAKVWSDIKDTIYDAGISHELVFKIQQQAFSVLNSYMNRINSDKSFSDSVTACHTYKP